MEWVNLIWTIIAALIGLIGGGIGILYWRENKLLKQKDVESKAIENELKQADAWKKLFDKECERNKDKSARLRELYALRDSQKEEINDCRFRIQQLEWFHCTVNNCPKRQPPHTFDKQGNEVIKE